MSRVPTEDHTEYCASLGAYISKEEKEYMERLSYKLYTTVNNTILKFIEEERAKQTEIERRDEEEWIWKQKNLGSEKYADEFVEYGYNPHKPKMSNGFVINALNFAVWSLYISMFIEQKLSKKMIINTLDMHNEAETYYQSTAISYLVEKHPELYKNLQEEMLKDLQQKTNQRINGAGEFLEKLLDEIDSKNKDPLWSDKNRK